MLPLDTVTRTVQPGSGQSLQPQMARIARMEKIRVLRVISGFCRLFSAPRRLAGLVCAALLLAPALAPAASARQQQALKEWRTLTAPSAAAPRVFARSDQVRFYFPTPTGAEEFSASWRHGRVPAWNYKVHSVVLHWDRRLPRMPTEGERGWREAIVIAGAEWRRLATNLIAELTPATPGHAAYYQAFLADGALYRDTQGQPHFAPLGDLPKDAVIEHRYLTEETLELLSRLVDQHLARSHPGGQLFLLMAPNAARVAQPLLLDRQQRRCVCLTPAALYDTTERGLNLAVTARGLSALLLEGHGLALLKNPLSSVARLADLGVETLARFLRLPLPKAGKKPPPLAAAPGLDLAAWESWLDRATGTRRELGSLRLLIDGDRFFSRLRQAIAEATNHVHFEVYIFDRDEIAVALADQLRQRAPQIEVKVLLDRMGSLAAGIAVRATPTPEDFTPPISILTYLQRASRVQARSFLNPWLSTDHSKLLLVDGTRAWLGGMNIGREYRYEWHDLMVEVQGPVVASFEAQFNRDWAHAGPLGDLGYAAALVGGAPKEPTPPPGPWVALRRLPTKTGWKPFSAAVQASLGRARNYIYVENPYLFDKRIVAGLVRARQRGVDVRVILPRVNDLASGARGNLVLANYLLEQGVRVFFYPGMTHVKALLVDGWACLGSGNLNHLSLRLNQEQNIATSDPGFAACLKHDLFNEDFARSYELTEPVSLEWMDFLADLILENF